MEKKYYVYAVTPGSVNLPRESIIANAEPLDHAQAKALETMILTGYSGWEAHIAPAVEFPRLLSLLAGTQRGLSTHPATEK